MPLRALARAGQKWWFTHQRLRSAHHVLHRLVLAGHLFTFLDPKLAELKISSTTNKIEGGINSPLRRILTHHRGLSEHHQRRALEWWLYTNTDPAHPPPAMLNNTNDPDDAVDFADDETDTAEVSLYDTALSAEEGLWNRSGWLRSR
ncbi:hypothetical protein [Microbacterium suwonense]|uniref:Transposase n=1 Tax=Microbacterium suwonense TaxID=683047 RepID=A0ABM8FR80_9MICO|nr:hypothetical protein [Microbacterium suwonense]BDZ37849.1 hypothetical protein GCM10025863_04630 [Microbacterium suwonense]